MEAISMDLRKRVITDCDAGMRTRQVASKYDVSESWVRRLKQRRRETGSIEPLPWNGGRPLSLSPEQEERLRKLVKQYPDATVDELHKRLRVKCCRSTIHESMRRLGQSFKKNHSAPRSGSAQT
jgi:transposase